MRSEPIRDRMRCIMHVYALVRRRFKISVDDRASGVREMRPKKKRREDVDCTHMRPRTHRREIIII